MYRSGGSRQPSHGSSQRHRGGGDPMSSQNSQNSRDILGQTLGGPMRQSDASLALSDELAELVRSGEITQRQAEEMMGDMGGMPMAQEAPPPRRHASSDSGLSTPDAAAMASLSRGQQPPARTQTQPFDHQTTDDFSPPSRGEQRSRAGHSRGGRQAPSGFADPDEISPGGSIPHNTISAKSFGSSQRAGAYPTLPPDSLDSSDHLGDYGRQRGHSGDFGGREYSHGSRSGHGQELRQDSDTFGDHGRQRGHSGDFGGRQYSHGSRSGLGQELRQDSVHTQASLRMESIDDPRGMRQESLDQHRPDALGQTRGRPPLAPGKYRSNSSHGEPASPQSRTPTRAADPQAYKPSVEGGRLRLRVVRALHLRNTDLGIMPEDASDPFVVAKVGRQEFKTDVVENNLNPVWNSRHFDFAVESEDAVLELEVFNSQQWHANDSLGKLTVALKDLAPGPTEKLSQKLDEEGAFREDGKQGVLEIELQLLSQDQLAGGHGRGGQGAQQQAGGAPGQKKAAPNWVPLPSFAGLGPEAFEAPKRQIEEAPVGQQRKMMETSSRACHLGQYDYSKDPVYFPNQEEVDKGMWRSDPFYGWRRELARQEHPGASSQPMLTNTRSGRHMTVQERSRAVLVERNGGPEQDMEKWQKDPFHGWLSHSKSGQPEEGLERMQEAAVARHLKRLPSFSGEDTKRFEDHREYSQMHKAAAGARQRQGGGEDPNQSDRQWKDDAFYGWLPGRGPDTPQEHRLARPLKQARDMRLPSFSEADMLGICGKPEAEGILSVWINGAANLAYGPRSGMRGKPSSCVRLRVGSGEPKLTSTIPTDANPRWNTPAMRFEVERADRLHLEVVDLASSGGEERLAQHFLGQVEIDVAEVVELAREQAPEPVSIQKELVGVNTGSRDPPLIEIEVLYEPYDDAAGAGDGRRSGGMLEVVVEGVGAQPPRRQSTRQTRLEPSTRSQPRPSHRDHGRYETRPLGAQDSRDIDYSDRGHARPAPPRMASKQSFRSNATSDGAQLGVLSIRVISGSNLVNRDTGILGDVSDPFCCMYLESQGESQRKRTHTIQNDLNPKWNTTPFLFPLTREDDKMVFEVFNENMLQANQSLGRLIVPLYKIVHAHGPILIRDELKDIEHGELEVEIGFSRD